MEKEAAEVKGIIAFVTTDKNRYLGGDPLALLAKDEEELTILTNALARAFMADVLQLITGDCVIIKK
ncbi:hypothetical protein J2S00_000672 [Caldalkalibacillus uzonensis]|uniref:Uncharacterized protein n=1 Tax=Caldalkalibacillus uzonensis TaxID=353224 RepID=A0ABU0CNB0_9BACI|nr:hypothetical protein [Caldalkalibacillus uzonensis]MDQ0337889.1 hypothetical protein [Caldalkalibacillus uzonensis]